MVNLWYFTHNALCIQPMIAVRFVIFHVEINHVNYRCSRCALGCFNTCWLARFIWSVFIWELATLPFVTSNRRLDGCPPFRVGYGWLITSHRKLADIIFHLCLAWYQIIYLVSENKQGKSEGFDSCDRPSNLKLDSNRQFFRPCDREIWWMTLQNNRAPLLCYFKLCASFCTHWWIQT